MCSAIQLQIDTQPLCEEVFMRRIYNQRFFIDELCIRRVLLTNRGLTNYIYAIRKLTKHEKQQNAAKLNRQSCME